MSKDSYDSPDDGASAKGATSGRVSVLGYALLGLLAREPLSGYDLAQRMKARVGFFWSAHHTHIYADLARLEAQGLVTHEAVAQQDRPAKKVYTVTAQGRAAVRAWATAPPRDQRTRDELVLKTYSLWLADPREAVLLFRAQEQRHRERLAEYERIEAHLRQKFGAELRHVGSPAFASYAALQRGLGYEREYAAWCGWVADQLDRPAGATEQSD